ncbi:MAG: 5-(carboxyamino)imidazole ribonucleotide synthase [Aestuariivita sp.]|nr:5-(carboxyamino)imidazole ribonucleotide synthase [Aestuariivita sp.]MCY4348025.1 5-(carboxyamino)imidazole ribonucleotide synthase [Aestuariivita sp.]
MSDPLSPGSAIGILGGGQLGRMLSVAASRLGFKTHIFDPHPDNPAEQVAAKTTIAPFSDTTALREFARTVDVVTYEFENIPTSALDTIEAYCSIHPNREALRISQDRLIEKNFLQSLGLNTAPFANIPDRSTMQEALEGIGTPAILKTRRLGYDGKGQIRIKDPKNCEDAFHQMQGQPTLLEGVIDFECEISVIAASSMTGDVVAFDPGENTHANGILRTTTVPSRLNAKQRTDAVLLAAKILNELNYVGVLGVELFWADKTLIVNEIAPRVHNSGHWTQNGCVVDQFEQHIRAITGLPLGDGTRYTDVTMENIIGDQVTRLSNLMTLPNTAIHLYGKTAVKSGRKMGHVNRVSNLHWRSKHRSP